MIFGLVDLLLAAGLSGLTGLLVGSFLGGSAGAGGAKARGSTLTARPGRAQAARTARPEQQPSTYSKRRTRPG